MTTRRTALTGLPTGFNDLDRLTSGFQAGDLILIVGRRSMGKTALALNIAMNVALRQKRPVGVISMAGSVDNLISRLLCSLAKISLSDLKNKPYCRQWQMCARRILQSPLAWECPKSPTIRQLWAYARRMKREQHIQLLIVDSLQRIRPTDKGGSGQVARGLKSLAKTLKVPVIVLSRLPMPSKASKRQPHERVPSPIIQASDVVGLLVRPGMYEEDEAERAATKGKACLIIAKNHKGPTGDVPLLFHEEYGSFRNLKFTAEMIKG